MILRYSILVPRGYSSPYFKGIEVIAFLKALNRCFKDYSINDDIERKERTAEYVAKRFKKDIKRLLEYKDLTL